MKKGNTAEVFDYDAEKICKFFYHGIPYEYVQQEYENAKKLFKLGIRIPEPFEIISRDGRHGIIYEKIYGTPMWESINKKHIFEKFITEHKKLLDISTDIFISYKDFLISMISGVNNAEKPEALIEEIRSLPDDNFVLHGDYHPDNVIVTMDGKFVIIDLLNVCRGPKEYDVARTFFLLENEKWQNKYLQGMGYRIEDIKDYLKIIQKTRKYEKGIILERDW